MNITKKGGRWLLFLGLSLLLFSGLIYGKELFSPTTQMAPSAQQHPSMM